MAEIAGLVVGAPPLLFYVLDNYKRALRPLRRFRKYEEYLEGLNLLVKAGNTAFQNAIEVLLTAVFSRAEALAMISDLDHHSWRDEGSERALKNYLNSNYEPVLQKVNEISDIISPLLKKIPDLADVDENSPKISRRRKAEVFFQRLQLCFKEEQFNYAMNRAMVQIEALNSFIAHPQQVEKAERIWRRQRRYTALDGTMMAFEVEKHSSKALFDIVQRFCVDHESHFVYFGLAPEVRDHQLAQISFELQYGQNAVAEHSHSQIPNFVLEVESSMRSEPVEVIATTTPTTLSARASGAHNTANGPLDCIATSLSLSSRCKKVKFDRPCPQSSDFEPQSMGSLPDFLSESKLCDWLSQRLATDPRGDRDYIGCVDRNSKCQLRFHVRKNQCPDVAVPVSFKGLFDKMSTGQARHLLPWGKKFRYARILASGVLRFDDTPWLPSERLHSENILLCGIDPSLDFYDLALPDPSINIPISTSSYPEKHKSRAHEFIKNQLVFRLGIMLTELALGESIEVMQWASERDKGELEGQKATAERMLAAVGRATHPRYQDVVRQCLRHYAAEDCLSACDDRHRKNFHDDIISELTDLEVRFDKLGISSDERPLHHD